MSIFVHIIFFSLGISGIILLIIAFKDDLYFKKNELDECECEKCGTIDEEVNVCGSCKRTICDYCMADFISGECLDCCED